MLVGRRKHVEFTNGQSFYYLGKSYRLLIVSDEQDAHVMPLKLDRGWFKLLSSKRRNARELFIRWYIDNGKKWIEHKVRSFENRIGVTTNRIRVLNLDNRWGSCTANGGLNFHWRTILAPPSIVEYIIVHEMIHLKVSSHTKEFWERVARIIPQYLERRLWLDENGIILDL